MSAPKRWLDEGGDATPFERDLLRSGLEGLDPPKGAKGAVWAALLTQVPGAGGLGGAGGAGGAGANGAGASGSGAAAGNAAGAAGAAGKAAAGKALVGAATGKAAGAGLAGAAGAGLLKSALIGAGGALAVIATYTVAVPNEPAPGPLSAAVPAAVTATARVHEARRADTLSGVPTLASAASAASPETPEALPSAEPRAPDARSGGGAGRPDAPRAPGAANDPPATADAAQENPLVEESRMMSAARAALRRGDSAGALAEIEKIRARFPGGGLMHEREALTIEALYRSGRKPEATARAAAFLAAHPGSLHATRVQAFTK